MKRFVCLSFALLILLCGCHAQETKDQTASTTTQTTQTTQSGTTTLPSGTTTTGQGVLPPTTDSLGTRPSGTTTTGTQKPTTSTCAHRDDNRDDICDLCASSVIVFFDFYSINDLHGKLADADSNIGVDELTTYLKNARETDENAIFLSAGDMWQGSAESNMTKGKILVDWMNELNFTAMALGNHEFDWGEEYIASNAAMAEFPFIAINVYDRKTNALVDYCAPSVLVEGDGLQIGIIGAIGDCYSSIAVDKCDEVYFKTGRDLTNLVKNEADRLRREGADFIVYVLHDGYGQSNVGHLNSSQLASYYDPSLSKGYIDLVFEGHTHQGYRVQDEHGVYHLQNRGDNKGGISHVEISINAVTMDSAVRTAELVSNHTYQNLEDDPIVEQLLTKYKDEISPANRVLGYNSRYRNSTELQQTIAKLYYEIGEKTWGDKYNIVLGGGFMSARSPYNLSTGEVTYADLQAIFPFDNQLTLCSIKGSYLRSKFLETNNDRYYIHCGEYGNSIRNNIDPNATYYLITDSYSAYYAPNRLTVIEEYDPTVFARDLLADYIEGGGFS
ncbi:MAG: metallophosphoesterase [Clostridia bacterium]|nr:metallophosphoesterase [Clostridia bacterium]